MNTYIVQRSLPGISQDELAQAQQSAIQTARKLSDAGVNVEYVRSTFLPDSDQCFCMFRAEAPEAVRQLNEEAGLPFERVAPALDLAP